MLLDSSKMYSQAAKFFPNCPPVMNFWFFIFPWFILIDPNAIKKVLSFSKHNQKAYLYNFLRHFVGNGVVTLNGEKWMKHRKILQPVFKTTYLAKFLEIFTKNAKKLALHYGRQENEVNITKSLNDCIFELLCGE
jgi:docosahexaenoic acid omega-hydroxylase